MLTINSSIPTLLHSIHSRVRVCPALTHAISDVQGENQDLRLQLAEERHARLELIEVVDGMRRGQEPRG
ncbi:hypothetical protein Tco_0093657, partial [Tanacetum coccineum]